MPVRHWRWRITFTVRYNRISGEECLADKCHDNDRLGLDGRITSFHHPTPRLRGSTYFGGRRGKGGWCPFVCWSSWTNDFVARQRHFALSSSFPLFFTSPFTSLLPPHESRIVWPHTYLRLSLFQFQTSFSLVPFLSNNLSFILSFVLSFILSSTILSSNSTWKSLTRRARDERERERKKEMYPFSLSHTCSSYD